MTWVVALAWPAVTLVGLAVSTWLLVRLVPGPWRIREVEGRQADLAAQFAEGKEQSDKLAERLARIEEALKVRPPPASKRPDEVLARFR